MADALPLTVICKNKHETVVIPYRWNEENKVEVSDHSWYHIAVGTTPFTAFAIFRVSAIKYKPHEQQYSIRVLNGINQ